MREDVPNLKNNESIIINLDDSGNEGTHWTACYKRGGKIYYYEPYGMPFPEELKHKNKNNIFIYNTGHHQLTTSKTCGWFCIYFINEMEHGKDFYDVIMFFDVNNQNANEKLIEKYFKKVL